MKRRFVALVTVLGLVVAASAQAGHHLWDFTEIYSSPSGTVQYIEMFTADNNEAGVGPWTITAGSNTFNFVTNLSTSLTANTYILIATSAFQKNYGGVTPDYIIPGHFFATGGGTLNYATGADIWNYGTVPTDGVLALQRNGTTATNSPTNFAGQSGSVNLTGTVPAAGTWGMVVLIGALLLASSGILRRRPNTA